MKFKDLKEQMFKDFIKWLEMKKIGDCFSNDVWAAKAFEILFEEYKESNKTHMILDNFMRTVPIANLEMMLAQRKKEQENKGNITKLPEKKIIIPGEK